MRSEVLTRKNFKAYVRSMPKARPFRFVFIVDHDPKIEEKKKEKKKENNWGGHGLVV